MFMSTRAGIFTVAALVACVSLAQGVVSRPISEAPAGNVESRPISLAKSEAAGRQACAFAFLPMLETPEAVATQLAAWLDDAEARARASRALDDVMARLAATSASAPAGGALGLAARAIREIATEK